MKTNNQTIITGTGRETKFQRHHGIRKEQIMRKGVSVLGQVVNNDQWGREGIIHCCVSLHC